MNYKFFLTYNVIGAFCWVASFVTLGYLFGGHPLVKITLPTLFWHHYY